MAHAIENVEIEPKSEILQRLNLSEDDFHQALEKALDHLQGRSIEKLPAPFQIPISVHGHERRLGELAQIAVSLDGSQATLCG